MKLHHIAIWTKDIEKMKNYYVNYFGCTHKAKYVNCATSFESYFLMFDSETRLELMRKPSIPENLNNNDDQHTGLIHLAISVGSRNMVDELTERLRNDGYTIISAPRVTGDGYYESCVLDPELNRVEITI